jgi:uncharacterized protein (TIGR03067 family)
MNCKLLAAIAWFLASGMALSAGRAEEQATAALAGQWKVIEAKTVNAPRPFSRQDFSAMEAEFRRATCSFTAETVSFQVGEEVRQTKYTLGAGEESQAIDLEWQVFPYYQKRDKSLGIYELKGDRLRICLAPGAGPRPTAFKPRGENGQLYVFVIELRRQPGSR